jgi:predicted nucleic acid-binding protein
MPFLIDSNVLIDVSRGHGAAIEYVDGLAESWALSQVTAMELARFPQTDVVVRPF